MNTLDAQFVTVLVFIIGAARFIYKKVRDIDKTDYDNIDNSKDRK